MATHPIHCMTRQSPPRPKGRPPTRGGAGAGAGAGALPLRTATPSYSMTKAVCRTPHAHSLMYTVRSVRTTNLYHHITARSLNACPLVGGRLVQQLDQLAVARLSQRVLT